MKRSRVIIWCLVALGTVWSLPSHHASGLRVEPYRDLLAVELVVRGLNEPSGMAIEPASGLLHVAEKGGQRISIVHERSIVPLIEGDAFQISQTIPNWAIRDDRSVEEWTQPGLRAPADIAFDVHGRMWVAESGRRGRLLRFEPVEDDFAFAQTIVSPWLDDYLGYTGVEVDQHGRVYTTMQRPAGAGVLSFGRVAMREPDGEWYLVDYGPFAEFSNVQLSQDEGTLVFAEHRSADMTWYDVDRQLLYAAMERVSGVRHVAMLPDGTTLASMERADGTWSLVEVDPRYGRIWEWAGGLGRIGGLAAAPEEGDGGVYVALADEGSIMKVFRVGDPSAHDEDRLGHLLQAFEMEHALPPKEWPDFFREFIERLGMVDAVDHVMSSLTPVERSMSTVPMTIDEFTTAIPVVAAKLKATLISPPEFEPDPITELSFVIFFPNRTIHTRQSIAPSISLFRAEHKSGRVVRTRFLPTENGHPLTEDLNWDDLPEVLVSFPSGYHAQQTGLSEEGLLRTYFLGMGLGTDYWIDVHRADKNRSVMMVEQRDGTKLEYTLETYAERPEAGGETVLVAGLTDVEKGWPHIGSTPVVWNMVHGETPPLNVRNMKKMDQSLWQHIPNRPAVGEVRDRRLPREEISFRRAIILRAATRWQDAHF